MPWSDYPLRELLIPQDAGPDDPRILVTTDPDVLADAGVPVSAAILFYFNATDFFYIGVTSFGADMGDLLIGVVAPSTSFGHDFAEFTAVVSAPELAQLTLRGFAATGTNQFSTVDMTEFLALEGGDGISLDTDTSGVGDYTMESELDAVSMSRGTFAIDDTSTSPAAFTAETVVDTLTPAVAEFLDTRRYRAEFAGRVSSSTAGDRVGFRIRRTNAAGAILRECGEFVLGPANVALPIDLMTIATGTNAADVIVLTCRRTAGAGNITYTTDSAIATDETSTSL